MCIRDSPRIQYHCHSLSGLGPVDVVAYGGSKPHARIAESQSIRVHPIQPVLVQYPRALFLVVAPIKVAAQIILLAAMLLRVPRPRRILLQNPPAIPSMLVALVICRLRGAELVVDWHNFGYSILALNLGRSHPVVTISYFYERVLGRLADRNLCVTAAMKEWLHHEWGVTATVLHDRPPSFVFKTPSTEQRLEVLREVDTMLGEDVFCDGGGIRQHGRPALLVSSTSWTIDEDFSQLLSVAEAVEQDNQGLPRIVAVITGKGDLREMYESKIAALQLTKMRIVCAWLKAEHYPVLLSCADLGVSLHYSSSNLDLPMKVVDMFGAGIPVCQVRYPCVGELVTEGETGLLFSDGAELTRHVRALFENWPREKAGKLAVMKQNVIAEMRGKDWISNWEEAARPLFL
eukprot:TRINITY_DN62262_c0_g1_i1.p2 TRINITY_DN62262_c0_g1~~TRINITY_DN62262_c0_g1_i1.p2  ORF type:complete len:404 (-),score=84.34 TRINITY_DN62262_c0_g1_i1:125-1336(-)